MLLAFSRSAEPPRFTRSTSFEPSETLRTDILAGIPLSPATVGEAYECLAEVGARLRKQGDPRAAFADVYSVITRRVRDAIEGKARSPFVEPEFISRLAGRFCALYLAALRRSLDEASEPIRAWGVADRCKRSSNTLPVQHAMLGLNAHINFDLAIGLYENIGALGTARDPATMARYRHDHDAVNRILQESIPEVMELLADRYGCPVARGVVRSGELGRALCGAALFTFRVWRSRVWRDLEKMVDASRDRAAVAARMNARSGVYARLIALPLLAPAQLASAQPAPQPMLAAA